MSKETYSLNVCDTCYQVITGDADATDTLAGETLNQWAQDGYMIVQGEQWIDDSTTCCEFCDTTDAGARFDAAAIPVAVTA